MLKVNYILCKDMVDNQVCGFYNKESDDDRDVNVPSSLAHDLEILLNQDDTRRGEMWSDLRDILYDLAVGRCTTNRVGLKTGPYKWLANQMNGNIYESRKVRVITQAVSNIASEFKRVTAELRR